MCSQNIISDMKNVKDTNRQGGQDVLLYLCKCNRNWVIGAVVGYVRTIIHTNKKTN